MYSPRIIIAQYHNLFSLIHLPLRLARSCQSPSDAQSAVALAPSTSSSSAASQSQQSRTAGAAAAAATELPAETTDTDREMFMQCLLQLVDETGLAAVMVGWPVKYFLGKDSIILSMHFYWTTEHGWLTMLCRSSVIRNIIYLNLHAKKSDSSMFKW